VRHAAIDAARIAAVARRYLRPERRVVGWCLPRAAASAAPARKARAKRGRPGR
jgi:hypothetical protein